MTELAPETGEENKMLNQLIESKNSGQEKRRISGFLFSSFTAVISVLTFALIFSLFSSSLVLGGENLNMSALVMPVSIAEQAPPKPEPIAEQAPKQQSTEKSASRIPVRQAIVQRMEESPTKIPDNLSVSKNLEQARPNSPFKLGKDDSNPASHGFAPNGRSDGGPIGSSLMEKETPKVIKEIVKNDVPVAPPPPIKQTPKPVKMISGGVVNGKATNLVKPLYSAAARAVRAEGQVKVQVVIDEDGNVTSANAISGHPLLQQAAQAAARSSKFSPTTLSNQKVKVTGLILYNFNL
jgi:TonB family protein